MKYFPQNLLSRTVMISLALLVLLSACMENRIQLSLKQIFSLAQKKQGARLPINVGVRFQISSMEECEKKKKEMTTLLKPYYENLKNPLCKQEEINTYLQFDARIPLVNLGEDEAGPLKTILHLTLSNMEGSVEVGIFINRKLYDELNQKIEAKYYQTLEIKNFAIIINMSNNLKKAVPFSAMSSYVDEEAVPLSGEFELEPGENVEVKVSPIMTQYIYENQYNEILLFEMEDSRSKKDPQNKDKEKNGRKNTPKENPSNEIKIAPDSYELKHLNQKRRA